KITVTDGKGGKVVHGYALPVITSLAAGKVITIAGDIDTTGFATITVPAGTPVLQVKLRGGSGDADLYVKNPAGVYSASARDGNIETLSYSNPQPGQWQIEIDGFAAYSGVSLSASLITPTLLSPNSSLSNLAGDFTSETFYRVTIPSGTSTFSVATSGGTGDVDVIIKKGAPAACQPFPDAVLADCVYDQFSAGDGNAETINISNPAPGDWYIDLIGYDAYTGVKLD